VIVLDRKVLQLDPADNVVIALTDLHQGETVSCGGNRYILSTDVAAKHQFATSALQTGEPVYMHGVLVAIACQTIRAGELITTANVRHKATAYHEPNSHPNWRAPNVSAWRGRQFRGYPRPDGRVGTRNHWVVVPLVFCENRNLGVLKQAFEEELGFVVPQAHRRQVAELVRLYREGRLSAIDTHTFSEAQQPPVKKVFPNIDGIKFLAHEAGCGGTHEDARNLCGLMADYIMHPNVAGATVLSLGCQHAQISLLQQELAARGWHDEKPLLVYEQQRSLSEASMLSAAVKDTFLALVRANEASRETVPLSKLCVGLKCGGSDGFSGISANPVLGHISDVLSALGGTGILAEFPELCGAEQNLIDRCVDLATARRFIDLMDDYAIRAKAVRAAFEMNPSPGNIRDGLITDAMKSAGAAKKGGSAPVTAVLDYPERDIRPGLNLLCTPGNDVECVTAQVAAGANVVLFTTGLGTPTGNPVAPVIKISSNSSLARRMADIIDFDAGAIIEATTSVPDEAGRLLEVLIGVANGDTATKAELSSQNDFIPWKRGISL